MSSYLVPVLLHTTFCPSWKGLRQSAHARLVQAGDLFAKYNDARSMIARSAHLGYLAPALTCVSHSLESLLLGWRPRCVCSTLLPHWCSHCGIRSFPWPWHAITTFHEHTGSGARHRRHGGHALCFGSSTFARARRRLEGRLGEEIEGGIWIASLLRVRRHWPHAS